MRCPYGYRWQRKKSSHTISLNIQNVTNRLNEFIPDINFNRLENTLEIDAQQQAGAIPVLKYIVNF